MQGDGLHATPAVPGLGVGIVIGVRVDVVGVGAALRVLDELNAGNADVVRGQEGLPGRDERVLEARDDLELVAWGDGRTGLTWLLRSGRRRQGKARSPGRCRPGRRRAAFRRRTRRA